MNLDSKEEWQKFLDWMEDNRDNLPEWLDDKMSMHECRLLWMEKVKND